MLPMRIIVRILGDICQKPLVPFDCCSSVLPWLGWARNLRWAPSFPMSRKRLRLLLHPARYCFKKGKLEWNQKFSSVSWHGSLTCPVTAQAQEKRELTFTEEVAFSSVFHECLTGSSVLFFWCQENVPCFGVTWETWEECNELHEKAVWESEQ